MSKSSAKSPAKSAERQERLAAALRANLKRRKAHARASARGLAGADKAKAPGTIAPAPEEMSDSGPIPAQKPG